MYLQERAGWDHVYACVYVSVCVCVCMYHSMVGHNCQMELCNKVRRESAKCMSGERREEETERELREV